MPSIDNDILILEKEQEHVLTAAAKTRTKTPTIIDGTYIIVATNKESVDMLSAMSSNASDRTKENKHYEISKRGGAKPMAAIELLSRSRTDMPAYICLVRDAETVNEYISSNPGVKYNIQNEEQLVSIFANELAFINKLYNQNDTKDHGSVEYYSNLSMLDFRAKAFYNFLTLGTNYGNPKLKDEINKDRQKAEQLSIMLDKKLIEAISVEDLFFVGIDTNKVDIKDPSSISADSFIKFGDHRDKKRHVLDKEAYLKARSILSGISGNFGKKRLESKQQTKDRKAATESKEGKLGKLYKPDVTILHTVNTYKDDDDIVVIEVTKVHKDTYHLIESLYNKEVKDKGLSDYEILFEKMGKADVLSAPKKAWLYFFDWLIKYRGGIKGESSGGTEIKAKFVSAKTFNDIIEAAYESISAGATAGGVTPAEQYNIEWEPVYQQIKKFEETGFETEDDINTEYAMLHELINRKCSIDEQKDEAIELLKRITSVKIAQLNAATAAVAKATAASTSSKTDPKHGYKGDGNQFFMNVRTAVVFGIFNEIDVYTNKREKFSWTKKMAAMCNELIGYEPMGVVTSTINKYQALRDFNGSVLKRAGQLGDKVVQVAVPNFDGLERIGSYIKNSTMQNAGEVDPEIVRLEQDLRNPGKFIRNLIPLKKHMSYDELSGDYSYTIKDMPNTPGEKAQSAENKQNYSVNKYLQKEGMDYYKLFGITGINEDFAPAGGFCEGTGGTNQVGEIITPGTEPTYPGMVRGLGAIHAPTQEQTTFHYDDDGNVEKTSESNSGSGDRFDGGCFTVKSSDSNTKKKKKYKPRITLIKV